LIKQFPLLGARQISQAVEQQPIDRLSRGAEGVGKGEIGHPAVATRGREALAVKPSELAGKLIT